MKKKYLFMTILSICFTLMGCRGDRKSDFLTNNSIKINKTCPIRVDSLIVLDSTYYNKENNSMTYFYSTSGMLDDSLLLNDNYAEIESALKEGLDNSVDMRKYKDYDVTVIYQYNSASNGNHLVTFTLPTTK